MSSETTPAAAGAAGGAPTAAEASDAGAPDATAASAANPTTAAASPVLADESIVNASAAAEAVIAAPLVQAPSLAERRLRAKGLAVTRRLVRVVLAVAILAGGVVIGAQVYFMNHAPVVNTLDPRIATTNPPLVVVELASAIAANDADRIQTVLAPALFKGYTAEIATNGIGSVDAVNILGTWSDGPRSASALVLLARSLEGGVVALNLIVVTDGGPIVSLR